MRSKHRLDAKTYTCISIHILSQVKFENEIKEAKIVSKLTHSACPDILGNKSANKLRKSICWTGISS